MELQTSQGSADTAHRFNDILVVDTDPLTTEAFRKVADTPLTFRTAASVDQAVLEMQRRAPELIIINTALEDNRGLELIARFRRSFPQTEAVAFARAASIDTCVQAIRAGAADMICGPLDPPAANACLERLAQRWAHRDRIVQRNVRLRSVCKQLNKARHEISQQVNLLCHDLVKAYQELAQQLSQTQTCGEFADFLGNEVEIEALMRQTMEWILKKLGPVNAAVFLPDSEQNYTLGAFLNFDTNADSVLTELIGQTIVPQAASGSSVLSVENDDQLRELFGHDASLLIGRAWMGCGAYYRNECLAVIVVFRSQSDPLDPSWQGILESASPILAEKIARAIRVYQRGMPPEDLEDTEEGDDGVSR